MLAEKVQARAVGRVVGLQVPGILALLVGLLQLLLHLLLELVVVLLQLGGCPLLLAVLELHQTRQRFGSEDDGDKIHMRSAFLLATARASSARLAAGNSGGQRLAHEKLLNVSWKVQHFSLAISLLFCLPT